MHTFRDWAARPKRLGLQLEREHLTKKRGEEDRGSLNAESAGAGDDYGFVLNGELVSRSALLKPTTL